MHLTLLCNTYAPSLNHSRNLVQVQLELEGWRNKASSSPAEDQMSSHQIGPLLVLCLHIAMLCPTCVFMLTAVLMCRGRMMN